MADIQDRELHRHAVPEDGAEQEVSTAAFITTFLVSEVRSRTGRRACPAEPSGFLGGKPEFIGRKEGKQAYNKYADPEEFYREAIRLYQQWRRFGPHGEDTDIPGTEPPKSAVTVEEAEERAWEQIEQYLQNMPPYEFQELVADLLRAMDYHVAWVAPPGKDRGIDIIAYRDPLGANNPRIKVQVKNRDQSVAVDGSRAFMSVLGTDDLGIFVASGGFASDAKEEARTQERRKVTLLDLENLLDLWIEHYPRLSQEARQRLPLKPIYFLAPAE